MPLAIEAVSPQDREWLVSELTPDTTPDQVHDIALRLLSRMLNDDALIKQAEVEVKRVANHLRDSEANQKAIKEFRYYQFGFKAKNYTSEYHIFNQFKVHEQDFPAFCKHFGLKPSEMVKVARGEIWSHKDWIQGNPPGNLGKRYTGDPRAFGISISGLRKGYQPVPNNAGGNVFYPAVWWTP